MSSSLWRVTVLPLQRLREHEEVDRERLAKLLEELVCDSFLRYLLLVDAYVYHYRWAPPILVLKLLGAKPALVSFEDYFSDKVKVLSWRRGWSVVKKLVLEVGLSGRKLPPKTSFSKFS
ncbi:MAG: hypothetical protein DRJ55_05100 [Thermoprotei archaeon]|nr:MAG: hypothetical protein DRJ55_05100 [Thermoprotei archaeon]